jgi:hypothetical protein
MVSCVRQNPDKQKPEQNQQVHDQEDASDPGFAGFGRAGADVVEIVTVPALTRLALNRTRRKPPAACLAVPPSKPLRREYG